MQNKGEGVICASRAKHGIAPAKSLITIQLGSVSMSIFPSICMYVRPSVFDMYELLPTLLLLVRI